MQTWKTIFRILLLLVFATLSACLLFPVVWAVVAAWMDYPPDRVFRRVWMLTILAGLILWRQDMGLRSPAAVGFAWSKGSVWNAVVGVSIAFVFLGILSAVYTQLSYWQWQVPEVNAKLVRRFFESPLKGAVIAGLEEYIFRGLIFLSLARLMGWFKAALVCSAIFSCLHFLEGRGLGQAVEPSSWKAGFLLCADLLQGMGSRFQFFPAAVGLFLVGMIMCHATIRTGTLWFAAGLHGGWIWYSTFCKHFFDYTHTDLFLTGGIRLFDGVIPIAGMLVIFPITYAFCRWRILHCEPIDTPSPGIAVEKASSEVAEEPSSSA
ncbi:MAG: CPBP family intramembrane glutamic endopeptidase [bacterium]|jgi:membrane protease YdiL (CAAX protease family)|nr:CPBP family intramembrane glutamic endopeptidase [bacterium]